MRITHGRVALELHELSRRPGPPLLLLHALFGSSDDWGEAPAMWPGTVYALDLSGHGRSDRVVGGGYYPETLAADADVALQHVGRAAVAGAGLGAYLALLLAGGRADRVPAALLLPGAGLDGGGPLPDFDTEFPDLGRPTPDEPAQHRADPLVRVLNVFVRPVDYVEPFARAARRVVLMEDGGVRPPWWEAVRTSPTAEAVRGDLTAALGRLAAIAGGEPNRF